VPETATAHATSLSGRILRWTFEDGPTAGGTYEHTFAPDGTVAYRKLDGAAEGKPAGGNEYAAFEVSKGVHLVSYRAQESGYTLTVALNYDTGRLYGFASNSDSWMPVSGTFEVAA
jgi:hypothetical protein